MTVYPFKPAPPMYIFTTSIVALAMASGLYTYNHYRILHYFFQSLLFFFF